MYSMSGCGMCFVFVRTGSTYIIVSAVVLCFFFKQKTAYEMRISDWSSDVCSSDLVGGEVVEVGATGEVARHPAVGRLDRDTDAVVLAHEQHRRRQPLVGGPGGGVERGLRGGVVARRVAEGADRDAVVGDRQRMADALALLDRHRGAEGLGQVGGDGRSLRDRKRTRLNSSH